MFYRAGGWSQVDGIANKELWHQPQVSVEKALELIDVVVSE